MELLSWLRGRPELSRLPAVVLSSSGLESDRAKAPALGARAYAEFSELADLARDLKDQFLTEPGDPRAAYAAYTPIDGRV